MWLADVTVVREGDHEAADHKEQINAGMPHIGQMAERPGVEVFRLWEYDGTGMIEHYQQHRDRTQRLDQQQRLAGSLVFCAVGNIGDRIGHCIHPMLLSAIVGSAVDRDL